MNITRFFDKLLLYKNRWMQPYISIILRIVDIITLFASILVVIGLFYQLGFYLSDEQRETIFQFSQYVRISFLIHIISHLALEFKKTRNKYRMFVWILAILLIITSLPVFFPRLFSHFGILTRGLENTTLNYTLFAFYAFTFLSNTIVSMLGKKTNPSLILSVSFFIIILLGTITLMFPKCTLETISISWVDALFTSTSAVCVTGLVPFDISEIFTTLGIVVILCLIQIGGLGVMTLTSFFAMFFMGNYSIYNQLVIKDMISSNSLGSSIMKTLLQVLTFTIVIELFGALFIFNSIHGTLNMSLYHEIFFSIFHSVSAFCNAGFSTLPGNLGNPMIMQNHLSLYVVVTILVILGGIGFPILVNLKDIFVYRFRKILNFFNPNIETHYVKHLYNLNTRIVLITTSILLVFGAVSFGIMEWNRTLTGMSVIEKIVHSIFNSAIPRTAGFNSVNAVDMHMNTLLIIILLMWIGGASQSTAGGIKVNSFAVSIMNLYAVIRNSSRVECFGREIAPDSIRRSNATIVLSLITLFIAIFAVNIMEPDIEFIPIVFECVSALNTVGSSMNVTAFLGNDSKLVLIVLMFVGRVGLITLLMSIIKPKHNTYRYPYDNIIIN